MSTAIQRDAAVVAREARRISTAADYDRLIERASQAQLILIGESSHGTQDFCQPERLQLNDSSTSMDSAPWYVRRIGQIAFACMSMLLVAATILMPSPR